jgi:hypothetical protein
MANRITTLGRRMRWLLALYAAIWLAGFVLLVAHAWTEGLTP